MNVYAQTAIAMPVQAAHSTPVPTEAGLFRGAMQTASANPAINAAIDSKAPSSMAPEEIAQTKPSASTPLPLAEDRSSTAIEQAAMTSPEIRMPALVPDSLELREGTLTTSATKLHNIEAPATSGRAAASTKQMHPGRVPSVLPHSSVDQVDTSPMSLLAMAPLPMVAMQSHREQVSPAEPVQRSSDLSGSNGHSSANGINASRISAAPVNATAGLGTSNTQQVSAASGLQAFAGKQMAVDAKPVPVPSAQSNAAAASEQPGQLEKLPIQHSLQSLHDLVLASSEITAQPGPSAPATRSVASNGSAAEPAKLRSAPIATARAEGSHAVSALADAGLRPAESSGGALSISQTGQHPGASTEQDKSQSTPTLQARAAQAFERMDAGQAWNVTPLRAESRRLEVGVESAALGWVEVRATADASGHVSASLHAQSDLTMQSLTGQLKEITNFVHGQSAAMDQVSVGVGTGSNGHRDARSEKHPSQDTRELDAAASGVAAGDLTYDVTDAVSLISVRA